MKKLITLAVVFVLTSIMISCKSSSVLKRRYNKGFYVHHAAKHSEPKANERTATVRSVQPVKPAANNEQIISAPQENKTPITAGIDRVNKKTNPVTDEIKAQNGAKALQANDKVKVLPAAFSPKQQFKLIEKLIAKAKSGDTAADDALSLLWILIVVLLILYLLGFAFDTYGIGPIYNLLALIIVVLLILWLLRIL